MLFGHYEQVGFGSGARCVFHVDGLARGLSTPLHSTWKNTPVLQVLINLLRKPKSMPRFLLPSETVDLAVARARGSFMRIEVADNGVGIPSGI